MRKIHILKIEYNKTNEPNTWAILISVFSQFKAELKDEYHTNKLSNSSTYSCRQYVI